MSRAREASLNGITLNLRDGSRVRLHGDGVLAPQIAQGRHRLLLKHPSSICFIGLSACVHPFFDNELRDQALYIKQ